MSICIGDNVYINYKYERKYLVKITDISIINNELNICGDGYNVNSCVYPITKNMNFNKFVSIQKTLDIFPVAFCDLKFHEEFTFSGCEGTCRKIPNHTSKDPSYINADYNVFAIKNDTLVFKI